MRGMIVYIIIVLIVVCNGTEYDPANDLDPSLTVCRTPACYATADRILKYMDHNVDPCQDFYRFACGNFLKSQEIPPEDVEYSVYTEARKNVELQLKTILEEEPNSKDLKHELYLKQIYYLCMDLDSIDRRGIAPIHNLIKSLGGWPVLGHVAGGWVEHGWHPMTTEVKIEKNTLGLGCFLKISTFTDIRESNPIKPRHINIDQPSLGHEREFLILGMDEPTVKEYFKFMVDVAVIAGANQATAERELRESLAFEIELAKILTPEQERTDFTRMFTNFTIEDLMAHPGMGWFDWAKFLYEILPPFVKEIPNKIFVIEPKYFSKLGPLIKKTQIRTLANFMVWRAIQGLLDLLGSQIIKRQAEFLSKIGGSTQAQERWRKCVSDVSSLLPLAMSPMYLKKYFKPDIKLKADAMVSRISEEMLSTIQSEDWMRFWTKQRSKRKMLSMRRWIGYPPQFMDDQEMNKFFSNLTMNIDDYFEAAMDLKKFISNMRWNMLNENNTKYREDWREHDNVFTINAYHNHMENSMEFPASLLLPPFFQLNVPHYVNFASIGNVIGHEITHGFDDKGQQFNFLGKLETWYDDWTKKNFDDRKRCFIEQYGNFTDKTTNISLNGEFTLGENIADNGGLKVTFHAYTNQYQKEPALPGLEHMNNNQTFLMSLGNLWCTKMRPEFLKTFLTTDNHSPEEFRVNGMMMNLEEFGQVFGCPVGSPMNPKNKCSLW